MAITVNRVEQKGEHWHVDLRVYEGVYRKDHYPVTVVEVGLPPSGWTAEQQQAWLGEWVLQAVREHMRSGALPPTGMRLNGEAVFQAAHRPTTVSDLP